MQEWDSYQPIVYLPKSISKFFVKEAGKLLDELKELRLEVILVPAPEPRHYDHRIRKVVSRNPKWYRELYGSNKNFRRDRSFNALIRIKKSNDAYCNKSKYRYDAVYRELIFKRLMEGYSDERYDYEYPSNNNVRRFFKKKSLEYFL